MKSCQFCGAAMSEEAARCTGCGWQRDASAPPPAVAPMTAKPRGGFWETAGKVTDLAGKVAVVALLVVGVVAAIFVVQTCQKCVATVKEVKQKVEDIKEKHREQKAADTASVANSEHPVEVSADNYARAYAKNEVTADATYKNSVVRIHGVVDRITKDAYGDPEVYFKTSSDQVWVACDFDVLSPELAKLEAGKPAVLRGMGDGLTGSTPRLRRCIAEK